MEPFGKSAAVYDEIYAAKDYDGEAQAVLDLAQQLCPHARRLLDLGCGTGRHAARFARAGLIVHGVDRSASMLQRATELAGPKLTFSQGDIRSVRLSQKFDVVVSIFHVMSYLPNAGDFADAVAVAEEHMRPGGVFFFDVWHGPGVAADPPERRERSWDDSSRRIFRVASPKTDPSSQCIDVHYAFRIADQSGPDHHEFRECHRMRYVFPAEVHQAAQAVGLDPLGPWRSLDQREAPTGWNAWYACRKPARD